MTDSSESAETVCGRKPHSPCNQPLHGSEVSTDLGQTSKPNACSRFQFSRSQPTGATEQLFVLRKRQVECSLLSGVASSVRKNSPAIFWAPQGQTREHLEDVVGKLQ